MNDAQLDTTIVGAGIVGLATAMELVGRRPDLSVLVLEKEAEVAAHQTGNNSGVIHAGLYYKPGSLKARLAVEGARQMVEFCEQHDLRYELCGKVVVATNDGEMARLEELHRRGRANGVPGLIQISGGQIMQYEPHATGISGLWSPGTGIVDYKGVARAYARIVEERGGEVRLGAKVTGIQQRPGELVVETTSGAVRTRTLINCGGLQSDLIARMTGSTQGLCIVPFRGEYYKLASEAQALVRGLIYPVPDPNFPFLGVHFTKKIDGSVEAGPNAVLAFAREGYKKTAFSPKHVLGLVTSRGFWMMAARYWRMGLGEMYRSWNKRAFVKALQVLVPEIKVDDLQPGGAGVRAQALDNRGNLLDDFCIIETPRIIHVLNAPSPAATASIAIGKAIVEKALRTFGLES